MKNTILILLALGLVFITACDKATNPLNTDDLSGTWSWNKSLYFMGQGENTNPKIVIAA